MTKLRFLKLTGNELTSLPWELGLLPNLEEITFDAEKLVSPPREVWSLGTNRVVQFLRVLNLAVKSCRLDLSAMGFIDFPVMVTMLPKLVELKFYNNKLRNVAPEIKLLTNLEELSLSNNQNEVLPNEIGHLTALEILNINDNLLSGLPNTLFTMVSLRDIRIQNNRLSSLPDFI